MDGCRPVGQRGLDEGELVAETGLRGEDRQIDAFLLLYEAHVRLVVILLCPTEVLLSLRGVPGQLESLGSDQPQLARILLRNRFEHVVQQLDGFAEVAHAEAADDLVVGVFVDVQRAQADVGKVRLAARVASIVAVGRIEVFVVRELVPWVEHLVGMHSLGAQIEVTDGLLIFASVDLHHAAVQIVILLVKDVFFVVIRFLSLLCICLVIALVGPLRGS